MNVRMYNRAWLRRHFPELAEQIKKGDVTISAKRTGKRQYELVVGFPNTTIYTPNEEIMMRIRGLLFIGCPLKNIRYKTCGLVGLEVICSFPKMPNLPRWILAYVPENPVPTFDRPKR